MAELWPAGFSTPAVALGSELGLGAIGARPRRTGGAGGGGEAAGAAAWGGGVGSGVGVGGGVSGFGGGATSRSMVTAIGSGIVSMKLRGETQ